MPRIQNVYTIKTMLGLGDAVYTFPIVQFYADVYKRVLVRTKYPDVFRDIPNVETSIDLNGGYDVFPSYNGYRNSPNSQFYDLLDSVNLPRLPFKFSYKTGVQNKVALEIRALAKSQGKKLCILKEPSLANMHRRNLDMSIVPNCDQFFSWLDKRKSEFFYVSVGQNEMFVKRYLGVDLDTNGKLTPYDLLSLVSVSDVVVSQVGHLVPIAQGLGIDLKIFWPEKITDPRLKTFGSHKIRIPGVLNEIL